MKALTIVVPVYNEVKNIERVTTELGKYMEKSVREIRILFVNDGSTDGSQELIEKACAENKGFSFIEFCENRGLTTMILPFFRQPGLVSKFSCSHCKPLFGIDFGSV